MILIFVVLVISVLLLSVKENVTFLGKCYSSDCGRNVRGKCLLKKIDIYNNGVRGICLWHTLNMNDRVEDSFEKGREVGKLEGAVELINKLTTDLGIKEDIGAINDPEEFKKWLKRHGINRQE